MSLLEILQKVYPNLSKRADIEFDDPESIEIEQEGLPTVFVKEFDFITNDGFRIYSFGFDPVVENFGRGDEDELVATGIRHPTVIKDEQQKKSIEVTLSSEDGYRIALDYLHSAMDKLSLVKNQLGEIALNSVLDDIEISSSEDQDNIKALLDSYEEWGGFSDEDLDEGFVEALDVRLSPEEITDIFLSLSPLVSDDYIYYSLTDILENNLQYNFRKSKNPVLSRLRSVIDKLSEQSHYKPNLQQPAIFKEVIKTLC